MDDAATFEGDGLPHPGQRQIARQQKQMKSKALNCLPCRKHKLRCDRQIPCKNCRRSGREDHCRKHPASAPPRGAEDRSRQVHIVDTNGPQIRPESNEQNLPLSNPSPPHHSNVRDTTTPTWSRSRPREVPSGVETPSRILPNLNNKVGSIYLDGAYKELESHDERQRNVPTAEVIIDRRASGAVYTSPAQPLMFNGVRSLLEHWQSSLQDQELYWKHQLCNLLPTRSQCDLLTCYYIENINWIFQSIHVPSFRRDYSHFWDTGVEEIDLIWLSLLYTIISVSGLYISPEAVQIVGIKPAEIRSLAHVWHSASRQSLQAGGFESKPCLTQLQTFSITQLYWYATNQVEVLNS